MDRESKGLVEVLLERLERSGLDDDAQLLVLAAVEGDEALADALEGSAGAARHTRAASARPPERECVYVRTVTVRGFRGIGPAASLRLQPGPGLTLVVGRNGSGKSSFAEAVEAALTGTSYRWKDKTSIWKSGWHNLHADEPASVTVELLVDGERGRTAVTRTWTGTDVDASEAFAQRPGHPRVPLESLGWAGDLATYRPFLSYAELGQMLEGKPSDMYDAMASILGLERLADAEKRLADTRRGLDRAAKEVGEALRPLLEDLSGIDDPRAREAEAVLRSRRRDLDTVERLAAGGQDEEPGELTLLRNLTLLAGPDEDSVAQAVRELRSAAVRVSSLRGTDTEEARRLADLLERGLDQHDRHMDDRTCPVCGTRDVLDGTWATRTRSEVERLRRSASEAEEARSRMGSAVREARALVTAPPAWLAEGSAVHQAWRGWFAGATIDDALALADHVEQAAPPLREACDEARSVAARRLDELEDRWRPAALRLGAWVGSAREVEARGGARASVKAGYDWLRTIANDLRNDRLRPLAERSAEVWSELRQESNVELGPVTLAGSSTQRRVRLDVTVDGAHGTALGVMSQGELHALALALFLPRATVPDSPFRFLVIDDPVQSMDPAKVDGLARVLSRTAGARQVVVFTHDPRLADAVRRLQLPATIWEVARREHSVVEVRKLADPVTRLLDDARALVSTKELPPDVAAKVVPGFCRSALEAALVERVRGERLAAGSRRADVEAEIGRASGAYELGALAYFGDAGRGGEVLSRVNRYGGWAGDTFRACKDGGHKPYNGSLDALVTNTERLTERVRGDH